MCAIGCQVDFLENIPNNARMVKKDDRKPRIMVNVEPDVYAWFRTRELKFGLSKSMLGTAAICALRALNDAERDAMVQWAKLFDDHRATWTEFEKACEATAKERAQALGRAMERALRYELGGDQSPPTTQESATMTKRS